MRLGGLEVYTTIDPQLQNLAREAIANHPVTSAAAALVSTDTQTGEILAMASSTNYDDDQFNLAAQGERQPGSAFKPFALTAAVEQGIDPDSTYYSAPDSITLDALRRLSAVVRLGRRRRDDEPPRAPPPSSINTVFAQLVLDIGAGLDGRDGEEDGDHRRARRLPGGGAGRPHHRRLRAPDVERLRDPRERRRPPRADGDRACRVPGRRGRRAQQGCGRAGHLGRRRLRGSRRDERDVRLRHR